MGSIDAIGVRLDFTSHTWILRQSRLPTHGAPYETSTPQLLASRRKHCRTVASAVLCLGANLSIATCTLDRRLPGRWGHGHLRPLAGSAAHGEARPAIRNREPGRR